MLQSLVHSHGILGEQSVGKSYALNHFVDTSFAGSAMRCTEGVWLSVTPTQDALVVSMDFEGNASRIGQRTDCVLTSLTGVNSIERSAQEGESQTCIGFSLPTLSNIDTLLVLFNAAISNLVCLWHQTCSPCS